MYGHPHLVEQHAKAYRPRSFWVRFFRSAAAVRVVNIFGLWLACVVGSTLGILTAAFVASFFASLVLSFFK